MEKRGDNRDFCNGFDNKDTFIKKGWEEILFNQHLE